MLGVASSAAEISLGLIRTVVWKWCWLLVYTPLKCKGVFTPGKSASSLALVRTKYNVVFLFVCLFVVVCFHTALFANETKICEQNH